VEIIDHGPNHCVIKEMSEPIDPDLNILRRIFVLLLTEADSIKDSFSGEMEGLKSIHVIDTNLDRFEDFCFRLLNKKGFSTLRKTNTMHSVIFTLEMLGDELKKIAIHMLTGNLKHTNMIKELFDVQLEQIKRFYKLFYKFDRQLALEIYEADKKGSELIEKYYSKLNAEEAELLHHFKKIGIYVLSLAELRMDMEF